MARLFQDPRYRGVLVLGALIAILLVVVIVARLMGGGGSTTPADGGTPAAPPVAPSSSAAPAPKPSATPVVRPPQAVFDAAENAAVDYLTAVNTWSFPLNLSEWQANAEKYVLATSPYFDQLIPSMSLSMMKVCEQERCSQKARVEPVGELRYLSNGGFRGRFLVTIESNYNRAGDRSTVWEVELFGTPPSVNFAVDSGTASGISD